MSNTDASAAPVDPADEQPHKQPEPLQHPQQERLLVRWFVRFNPLFTLSALCVLAGVLLLSQHWRSDDPSVGLTVVVEAYQWLLIGTAALLYRRLNEHRPGVILGIIALVFLVDPTLQLSALASSDHLVACVVWVVLVALKLQALQRAFCLRLSTAAQVLPVLLAAFVALLPNARLFDDVAEAVPGVLAIGVFVLGALATLLPVTAESTRALGDVGAVMFPRVMKAAAALAVFGALFQGGNAVYAMGAVKVMPAIGACFLILVIRVPRSGEIAMWFSVFMGMSFCATLPSLATVLGAAALIIASRQHAPRTLVVGLLLASSSSLAALRDGLSGAPAVHVFVVVLMTLVMLAVLLRQRAPSAAVALASIYGLPAYTFFAPLMVALPRSTWGIALVGAGFALLPFGVYAHRRLSRMVAAEDERLARATPTNDATPA